MTKPTAMLTTTVLIVDDHELIREALRGMLNGEPNLTVCGEATGTDDAMECVQQLRPGLVIVDLSLRSGDGIDLIRKIRAEPNPARCIVMSMYDERIYGKRAMNAGAEGYVNKHDPAASILDAVRSVLDGKPSFQSYVLDPVKSDTMTATSPVDRLSDREFEVFRLLGEGLSVKQIALRMGLSPKTVEYYRENAKRKLDLGSSAELLHFAIRWHLRAAEGPTSPVQNGT